MNIKFNKKNKKLNIIIMIVLTLIAAVAGATYAFFSILVSSGEYVTGTTGFDSNSLKLDVVQLSQGTGKLIPQLDSNIQLAVAGTNGKGTCLDKSNNTVCKVYSVTITNQAEIKMNVTGTLNLIAESMPNLKWSLGTSPTTGFPTPTGAYYTKTDTELGDIVLEPKGANGNSQTYYIVIWISEQNDVQNDTGKFSGTVSFSGYTLDEDGNNLQGITSGFRG